MEKSDGSTDVELNKINHSFVWFLLIDMSEFSYRLKTEQPKLILIDMIDR